jgi:hypothetical protein
MCGWTTRFRTRRWQRPTKPGNAPPDFRGLGKIAALGIKVSRHCTYHGVALNVAMDLEPFSRINPCGYARLANGGSFYNRGICHLARSRPRAGPPAQHPAGALTSSTLDVLRQAITKAIRMSSSEPCAKRKPPKTTTPPPSKKPPPSCRRIPVKVEQAPVLKKPEWIRVKAGSPTTRFYEIKDRSCARTSWSPCAKKPAAPTSANALARARPPS